MDRRDDCETESSTFFDATCTSENEWNIAPLPRADSAASEARPAAHSCGIMVIGFGVIRL